MSERTTKLWIDADAAPTEVKEIVFRAARRLNLTTHLVANRKLWIPGNAPTVSSIVVREGANVADRYIVVHAQPGDLAVTADIPLAADLVEKGIDAIDPRGQIYDASNIRQRLSMRDFMEGLRAGGMETSRSNPYGDRDKQAFASALDRSLTRLINQAKTASQRD